MNHIFDKFLSKSVIVFFDYILLYIKDITSRLFHLEEVFQLLVKHQLVLKQSKCIFGQTYVSYLGHTISDGLMMMDNEKVQAVSDWPFPNSIKELRGFLGLTGSYRKFIRNYGIITAPLIALLKKDSFRPDEGSRHAFEELKRVVTTKPVLALPYYSLPFVIECDASMKGVGAVLM